jgi:DNA polymerase III subunit alpha
MYTPLQVHCHYTLQKSPSKPKDIAKRVKELDLAGCALTDIGNLCGSVQFVKAMKEVDKKPILGCEIHISNGDSTIKDKDNTTSSMLVLAKNNNGWKSLIKLTSLSNHYERFYRKPRIDYNILAKHTKDVIGISGHIGSTLANALFVDPKLSYSMNMNVAEHESNLKPNWLEEATKLAEGMKLWFGEGNFYLGIQLNDTHSFPAQLVIASCLRTVGERCSIPRVAVTSSFYCKREDSLDQRVLLCSLLQTTMNLALAKLEQGEENFTLGAFFKSDHYHIPEERELFENGHTLGEIENTNLILAKIESYNILKQPILPKFACPNGISSDEYLRQLCREGWKAKIQNKIKKELHQVYTDRVKEELGVLQGAGLSDYFLICADIMNFVRKNRWLPGPGRGSAAGCLVSYLTNITSIDSVLYNLLFSRFYNEGRNTKDRVAMPDVDLDVPAHKRGEVIQYVRDKYGNDRVSQMITFQTTKGRAAMKDVLRAYGGVSFDLMNQITQHIPDEAKIAGDLQEMREETGESSIIRWTLENKVNEMKEWCYIDAQGELQGPLAKRFEQAIRLEGIKRSQSRHASGLIISPEPLEDICPMVLDNDTKLLIAGLEMNDLEAIGMIKFDILGLRDLSKLMSIQEIAETGDMLDE